MSDAHFVVIDCPFCRLRVRAESQAPMEYGAEDDLRICVTLARCPGCHHPLVAYEEFLGYEGGFSVQIDVWSKPQRVWPKPQQALSHNIPEKIAASLKEAQACLTCGTFTASVAMSGRALEAIGRHFHTKGKTNLMLAEGLEELRDNHVIDQRLYEWGKELKDSRNLAAHASDQAFDRDDAQDIYDFAVAICEYVFVLTERFEEFKMRQKGKELQKEQQA